MLGSTVGYPSDSLASYCDNSVERVLTVTKFVQTCRYARKQTMAKDTEIKHNSDPLQSTNA